MVEPDLSLPMPSQGTDVLVVYTSTEPVDLTSLTQAQIKLDCNLVPEEGSGKVDINQDVKIFLFVYSVKSYLEFFLRVVVIAPIHTRASLLPYI